MKGRSEKPDRAALRVAPSQSPTRGTLDAASSARTYAASAPAHACKENSRCKADKLADKVIRTPRYGQMTFDNDGSHGLQSS